MSAHFRWPGRIAADLLTTLAVPDSEELVWSIPTKLLPATLDGDYKIIADFLLDPVDPNGKTAADLLRKKRKAPVRKRRERPTRINSDGEEVEDEDAAPIRKRQKKKKEELEAYKSAQFIEDSDDDAEADRAFFAREAEAGSSFIQLLTRADCLLDTAPRQDRIWRCHRCRYSGHQDEEEGRQDELFGRQAEQERQGEGKGGSRRTQGYSTTKGRPQEDSLQRYGRVGSL